MAADGTTVPARKHPSLLALHSLPAGWLDRTGWAAVDGHCWTSQQRHASVSSCTFLPGLAEIKTLLHVRPHSSPRCPAAAITIVRGVRRTDEEPPQAEQGQRDAQENAKVYEHVPIIESAAKPSNDRRRGGATCVDSCTYPPVSAEIKTPDPMPLRFSASGAACIRNPPEIRSDSIAATSTFMQVCRSHVFPEKTRLKTLFG
jgi:hypothetical protein